MMRHSLWMLLGLLLLMGCKPKVPSGVIQPRDMENILYDYHISQAMGKSETGREGDYSRNKLFLMVLKKHNVSEAEFDSSLVYYYSHLDRFQSVYRRVNDRLREQARGLGAAVGELNRYSRYSLSGDTANIWTGRTDVLLTPCATMNRFDFTVKADTTFRLGDSFTFQFLSEYIWQSGGKDAVICIAAAYEGADSVVQYATHCGVPGIAQLQIPSNRTLKVKELRGFIYLASSGEPTDTRKLMFIKQIQLIRFHHHEIQNNHEAVRTDTITTDSLQRGANPAGTAADTTGAQPVGQGLRSKSAPFRRRDGADPVAAGQSRVGTNR